MQQNIGCYLTHLFDLNFPKFQLTIFFLHYRKTHLLFLFCIDKTPSQFLYHIYGTRFINFIELFGNYIQRIDTFVGMSKHAQSSRYFFLVIIGHCLRQIEDKWQSRLNRFTYQMIAQLYSLNLISWRERGGWKCSTLVRVYKER